MKKLNSKLFNKFELKNQNCSLIVGGSYTAVGQDTNMTNGEHDITFDTSDSSGQTIGIDTQGTGTTTRDKPGNC